MMLRLISDGTLFVLVLLGVMPSDISQYLECRFLEARKFDFEMAAEMWEEMLERKNEFGTGTILKVRILSILRN
jgi:hypothetical protein